MPPSRRQRQKLVQSSLFTALPSEIRDSIRQSVQSTVFVGDSCKPSTLDETYTGFLDTQPPPPLSVSQAVEAAAELATPYIEPQTDKDDESSELARMKAELLASLDASPSPSIPQPPAEASHFDLHLLPSPPPSIPSVVDESDLQPSASTSTPAVPVTLGSTKRSRPEESSSTLKKPRKKSRPSKEIEEKHPYDCSGLVPRYTRAPQVPPELLKYFYQRTRMFKLYNNLPFLMDHEGWFSLTPEAIAERIAERLRCNTILDAFCGCGGNAIAFARTCERVITLDTSPLRLKLARHNAHLLGLADRIEFVNISYFDFIKSRPQGIDCVFLSPPWGGPSYLSNPSVPYPLSEIQPVHGKELFDLTRQNVSRNIGYYLPRNVDLEEISNLGDEDEKVEIEEEWMSGKLKALTVIWGSEYQIKGEEAEE